MQYIRLLCILASIVLSIGNAYAGIKGRVLSKVSKKPIENSIVTLYDAEGKAIAFTTSAPDGLFTLEHPLKPGAKLTVRMMGYETYALSAENIKEGELNIYLVEKVFSIKEVAVKTERIKAQGDTISYMVSTFTEKQDRSIGDVLARMPGINVESSGRIQYQGLDINKLYIEGQDLLEGKYGVATKGISAQDIARVEVMENHQPMQVLRGISYSDQAAINLKLKSGKRSAWLVHGLAGVGLASVRPREVWQGELFAMNIGRSVQTLISLKSNNVGVDLSREQEDFIQSTGSSKLIRDLELSLGGIPALDDKRRRFNRDLMTSINQMYKLSPSLSLRLQADYLGNSEQARLERQSIYYRTYADETILERQDNLSRRHMLRSSLGLEANQKGYFLNNTTSLQADWSTIDLSTWGSYSNRQIGRKPTLQLANRLKWIQRLAGKYMLSIGSTLQYDRSDSHLEVSRLGRSMELQSLEQYALYTKEQVSYGFKLGKVSISLEGAIEAMLRRASRESNAVVLGSVPFDGDIGYYGLELIPTLEWGYKRFLFKLGLPLQTKWYSHYQGRVYSTLFNYVPHFNLRYRPSSRLSFSLSATHGKQDLDVAEVYTGYLQSNYRSLHSGYDALASLLRYSLSARLQYRNTGKGLFANLLATQSWVEHPYYRQQDFLGDYITNSYILTDNRSRTFALLGSLNKTIDYLRGGAGIKVFYSQGQRAVYSEGVDRLYINDNISTELMLNGHIGRNLFFLYELGWSSSALRSSLWSASRLHNLTNSLELTYTPSERLRLSVKGKSFYNQLSQDTKKSVFMVDVSCNYRLNTRLELSLALNNLLNHRSYAYTNYGALNAISISQDIRGRELLLFVRFK